MATTKFIPDMKGLAKELDASAVMAFAPPAVRKAQQITSVDQVKRFADIPTKKLDQMETDLLALVKDWQDLAQSIRDNLKRDTDQLEALGDKIKERAQYGVSKLEEIDKMDGWGKSEDTGTEIQEEK